eukprot:COSAG02_NODE_14577_length_1258_cov_1.221743_1_plen_313_part_10
MSCCLCCQQMIQQIKYQLGFLGDMLGAYAEKAVTMMQAWMDETGRCMIAEAKQTAAKELKKAGGNNDNLKPGKSEKELMLATVKVPTADFHKAGLIDAIAAIKPVMVEKGGIIAEFADKIDIESAATKAIHLRRGLCQLIQESVLDGLKESVFPEIESRLTDIGIRGPLAGKVRELVYDTVEDLTRAQIYDMIATAYGKLESKLAVPGCSVAPEPRLNLKKEKEDEFGWPLAEGGWKKERKRRKAAGVGPGSPMESVEKILNEAKDSVFELTGGAGEVVNVFIETAQAAYDEWLSAEGTALIEAAEDKPKKMA